MTNFITLTAIVGMAVCSGGTSPGDECEDCIPILDGQIVGTTLDNTGDVDDTTCTPEDTIDEWYCYTAQSFGLVTIGLCDSSFDTSLAVFNACSGTEVACNDDACGAPGFPAYQSGLSFGAHAGESFKIRVSGYFHSAGDFLMYVHQSPNGVGPGTTCYSAITVTDGVGVHHNIGLLAGDGHPTCYPGDVHPVWFLYVPTCYGVASADTCINGIDTRMELYDDCGKPPLECDDDDGCGYPNLGSKVTWNAEAGRPYFLRISGYEGEEGPFYLRIQCEGCGPETRGDFDANGMVNGRDVGLFVYAVQAHSMYPFDLCAGDYDFSGELGAGDIAGFVEDLIGG